MLKAMEELRAISVGTKLPGKKLEVTCSLKHEETQETKVKFNHYLFSQPARCREGEPDWHCPSNSMPPVHAHQKPHGYHHSCEARGAKSGQLPSQGGADITHITLTSWQKLKSKLLFLLKMKSAETCLLPPCCIGQFVSMFNGVLISLAESRMRIDLLVEKTSTRTFNRDH